MERKAKEKHEQILELLGENDIKVNNLVLLEGIVGDDFKKGKTQEGKNYVTFSLIIQTFQKEVSDASERNFPTTYIRVLVFDNELIEYVDANEIRRGVRVSVFGRLSSHKNEYKGIVMMTNNVVCRNILKINKEEKQ